MCFTFELGSGVPVFVMYILRGRKRYIAVLGQTSPFSCDITTTEKYSMLITICHKEWIYVEKEINLENVLVDLSIVC